MKKTAKQLREERKKIADDIGATSDKIVAENREFTAEEQATWDKLNADYKALTGQISIADTAERIRGEQIEPAGDRDVGRGPISTQPGGLGATTNDPEASTLAIQAWFRCNSTREFGLTERHRKACEAVGLNPAAKELTIRLLPDAQLANIQDALRASNPANARQRALKAIDYRAALSSVSATDGGAIMAPETMMGNIEVNMLAFGGILQAAEIMRTSGREPIRWPTANDTSNKGRRLGESQPVTTTTQPTFGAVVWNLYKYTSDGLLVPYELLSGTPYNLPGVLGGMMGERIGRKGCDDFTTGSGANQPKGAITCAGTQAAASATAIAWDDLETLIGAVDPAYRIGASFMFHDNTRQALKKLKDGNGRPLWADSPNGSEPSELKGYPWFINQSMDSTIASGKKTVSFGQHTKYQVRQFETIRIYRLVERQRENDQDEFLAFAEMDGNMLDAGTVPVKVLLH
jgi:HK97 family phage major capsid protein